MIDLTDTDDDEFESPLPPPRPTKEQVVHMRAEEYKVEGNELYGIKQYLLASKQYDLDLLEQIMPSTYATEQLVG